MIDIGGIRISLECIPPNSSRIINNNVGIKVLSGSILWQHAGKTTVRTWCTQPKTVSPITVNSDDIPSRIVTSDCEGAVIFAFTLHSDIPRFETMEQITLANIFPTATSPLDVLLHQFKWTNYGDIDAHFKGVEFYNFKGINIYQSDEHLVNTQFWAAAKKVDCGLHNHLTNKFCEVHTCFVNGTGQGGMTYADTLDEFAPQIKLPVPSLHEHGPLWVIKPDGTPDSRADGTVVYPWHKWLAGSDHLPSESYDVWVAFEFNPVLAIVQ